MVVGETWLTVAAGAGTASPATPKAPAAVRVRLNARARAANRSDVISTMILMDRNRSGNHGGDRNDPVRLYGLRYG